ncbi:hypothetical protein KGY77_05960 [Candidatus Bipolaricaulota bacterium]|nr:hypothetical protein [Candidatus Bipolaricaulota bacterium]
MQTTSLDLYDILGIIAPGTVFLLGIAITFNAGILNKILVPQNLGYLGVYLILAYVTGHLIQAIGNLVEYLYWTCWGGKPTNWPISRPESSNSPENIIEIISNITNQELPDDSKEREKTWKKMIAQTRSKIFKEGSPERLKKFNALYGMFRGLIASALVLLPFVWKSSQINSYLAYYTLSLIIVFSSYRMHRFSQHYKKELFASARDLHNS